MATTFTSEGIPTYMMDTPNAQMPNPKDSATLPMFNAQEVAPDAANVACEGDEGGACL
jgi:hypothetical protein